MRKIIIALNTEHLKRLIEKEISEYGNECDLNHIDISLLTRLNLVFAEFEEFNGDISKWNTKNIECMTCTFDGSKFNGDISNWDTSSLKYMGAMFRRSIFSGDISKWDVSNVKMMHETFKDSQFNTDISNWNTANVNDMEAAFYNSPFMGDISNWDVSNVKEMDDLFKKCQAPKPLWYIQDYDLRQQAIFEYKEKLRIKNDLEESLVMKKISSRKIKV